MKRTASFFVLVLSLFAGFQLPAGDRPAVAAEIGEEGRSRGAFEAQVLAIDKAMGDNFFGTILGYDILLVYPPFKELSRNAKSNIDSCAEFLSDPSHTEQQQRIAALGMHLLDVDDYVIFGRKLIGLYDRQQITYWEFMDMLVPHKPFSEVVSANFDHPGIRALLTDVLAREDIRAGEKTFIKGILSGETWANGRLFDADCCDPSSVLKRPVPKPPLEFMLLVRLFKWNDYVHDPDRRGWIGATLRRNSQEANLIAKGYFDILLARWRSDDDDHDLETVWRVWNPGFGPMEPGAMRELLAAIRDEIAAMPKSTPAPPDGAAQ